MADDRIWLDVPYAEKDDAKAHLPAHPPHGVRVLVPNHRSNLGVCEDRRSRNRPLEAASPLHWRFLRTGLVP